MEGQESVQGRGWGWRFLSSLNKRLRPGRWWQVRAQLESRENPHESHRHDIKERVEREQKETPKPLNLQKGMVGASWGGAAVPWGPGKSWMGWGGDCRATREEEHWGGMKLFLLGALYQGDWVQAWSQGKSNESWEIRVRTSRGRFSISCFLMMAGAEIACKSTGGGGGGGWVQTDRRNSIRLWRWKLKPSSR